MPTADELMQGLLDSMQDLENAEANAKIMIYGESGVGKTVEAVKLAQTIVKPGKRVLYIDAVEGWVSLKNHKGLTDGVTRFVYNGYSQLMTLAQAIEAGVEKFKPFDVIVFDELSTMSKKDLDMVLSARAEKDRMKDPDVPTQPDFFANTERMRRLMMKMLALDISVVVVAHLRNDKDDKIGYATTRPGFMPKFSETLRENMHVVAHMTADEKMDENGQIQYLRSLQVHPTRLVVCKSRVGGLSTHVDPDEFNAAVVEWMRGDREDQDESLIEIKNDEALNIVESDDFVGVTVED